MGKLIFLASYPKSGNTWFRSFLSNLLKDEEEPFMINQMKTDGIYSSRPLADFHIGVDSSLLTNDEVDAFRKTYFSFIAETSKKNLYVKAHDAYTYLADGSPLFVTKNAKALYFIRNPLDVAVSFAYHSNISFEESVNCICDPGHKLCDIENMKVNQLRQKLLTWGGHVKSFVSATELPVHFMRYEDMKLQPLETFKKAVEFIELDCSEEDIKQAIEASSFSKLQKQEQEIGFKEKSSECEHFFRKGEIGDWRNHLSRDQVKKIIDINHEMMEKFGYLDAEGEPVY